MTISQSREMTAKSGRWAPGPPPPEPATRAEPEKNRQSAVSTPAILAGNPHSRRPIQSHASPKISYFPLAKKALIPSLPVPCQESEEKQKHGKPLPSVSKSLEQGKFFVGNKGLATCCKARTANASVVLAKLLSSPMLTFVTSERIFLFPVKLEIAATNNSSVRSSDGLYPA